MTIKEIKNKILNWIDFYGGDIIDEETIRKAKTKREFLEVLQRHSEYLEHMAIDAQSHLNNFIKELTLVGY